MSEFEKVATILLEIAFLIKMVPPLLFLILGISSEKVWGVTNVATTIIAFLLASTAVTMWVFPIVQHSWVIYAGVVISGCLGVYYLIKLEKKGAENKKGKSK